MSEKLEKQNGAEPIMPILKKMKLYSFHAWNRERSDTVKVIKRQVEIRTGFKFKTRSDDRYIIVTRIK